MNLKEFYNPLWAFGLVLIGMIVLVNLVITGSVRNHPSRSVVLEKSAAVDKPLLPENIQNSLSPDKPTRYDIVEHDEKDRPQDPGQWDYMIKKTFQDAGLEDKFKHDRQYQSLVTSHEDYQKRLAGVQSLIGTNEEKLKAAPDNTVIRQQLNELYKLRSALIETEKYLVE